MGRKTSVAAYDKKLEKIKLEIESAKKNLEAKVSKYDAVRKKRDEAIADEITEAVLTGRVDYDDFMRILENQPQIRKRRSKKA